MKQEILGKDKVTDGNFTYYKNNNIGTYTVFVEDGRSNNYILISSKDLTILHKVYNSLEARIVVNEDELQDMYSENYYDNSSKYY